MQLFHDSLHCDKWHLFLPSFNIVDNSKVTSTSKSSMDLVLSCSYEKYGVSFGPMCSYTDKTRRFRDTQEFLEPYNLSQFAGGHGCRCWSSMCMICLPPLTYLRAHGISSWLLFQTQACAFFCLKYWNTSRPFINHHSHSLLNVVWVVYMLTFSHDLVDKHPDTTMRTFITFHTQRSA